MSSSIIHYKSSEKVYANNCQKPREVITFYENGRGKVSLYGQTASFTWEKKKSYIQMKQDDQNNIITAHYDPQGNLILQSFSHRNEQNFNRKERIRYRCPSLDNSFINKK